MATRTTEASNTLETFRVNFNGLVDDIGNVTVSSAGDQLNTTASTVVGAINEIFAGMKLSAQVATFTDITPIYLQSSNAETLTLQGGSGVYSETGAGKPTTNIVTDITADDTMSFLLNDNIVSKTTWFDGSLSNVWQTVDHETLSKNPGMDSLKRYLSREVALGHLVRQELSSMIPPLFLASGLQSRHNVLDVCAAPGSKSELLLHLMQESPDSRGQVSGMVIANDADPHRIETLINRFKRCPNPNLVCTCNKAEEMAKIIAPSSFKFDRILLRRCTGLRYWDES